MFPPAETLKLSPRCGFWYTMPKRWLRSAHDAEDLALVQVQADVVAGHHRATVWADVGVHVGASALQAEFATPAVDLGQSAYFQNFFHTVVS